MADRSAAELFSEIFKMLASDKPIDRQKVARRFWELSGEYDFSHYQLYCDKALIKLGLARKGVDPQYPDDGKTILYGPVEEEQDCGD